MLQLLKLPDGTVKVLVEGKRARRACCASPTRSDFYEAEIADVDGGRRRGARGRGAVAARWSSSSKTM